MWLQRQHFLLSYFKTLSVGPAGVELTTSHVTAHCSTTKPPVRSAIYLSSNHSNGDFFTFEDNMIVSSGILLVFI